MRKYIILLLLINLNNVTYTFNCQNDDECFNNPICRDQNLDICIEGRCEQSCDPQHDNPCPNEQQCVGAQGREYCLRLVNLNDLD